MSVEGALAAKPEVEIWRRPDFWTFRPQLPIRPPILYWVYLAPLRNYPPPELLPLTPLLRPPTTRKYSVENAFSNFERIFLESWNCDFFLNFHSPQHVQLHEVTYGPKYRPPRPLATGTKNSQKNPEIRFFHKIAAKTTSGSGFRPYSCSPPSTWLI